MYRCLFEMKAARKSSLTMKGLPVPVLNLSLVPCLIRETGVGQLPEPLTVLGQLGEAAKERGSLHGQLPIGQARWGVRALKSSFSNTTHGGGHPCTIFPKPIWFWKVLSDDVEMWLRKSPLFVQTVLRDRKIPGAFTEFLVVKFRQLVGLTGKPRSLSLKCFTQD